MEMIKPICFLCAAVLAIGSCRPQDAAKAFDRPEASAETINQGTVETLSDQELRKKTILRVESYLSPNGEREFIVSYRCSTPDLAPPDVDWSRLAASMNLQVEGAPLTPVSTAAYFSVVPDSPSFATQYLWERLNGRSNWRIWPDSSTPANSQHKEAKQAAPSNH